MNIDVLRALTAELNRAECQLALAEWEMSKAPTAQAAREAIFHEGEVDAIALCMSYLAVDRCRVEGDSLSQCVNTVKTRVPV